MARTETRLGYTSALGTAYTAIGTAASTGSFNLLLNVVNRGTATANVRAYIAASGWSSGEPTGATLVSSIVYDYPVGAYDPPFQVSGVVMGAGEKLIVRSDTASSLDVIASGVQLS